jgi:hypothetical protein
MNAFSECEQHVKHLWRKRIGILRISFGPITLDGLQFSEPARKHVAELKNVLKRLLQIAEFIQEINLGQVRHALIIHLWALFQPFAQHTMAGRRDLIKATLGTAFRACLAATEQALAFESLQRGIDLAELGGPKIMDALVENGLQIVAAGGLSQQAKQDVFQAHEPTI